ncbi:MAG: DUF2283 domain-containing protein [Elusimicrobia bacterium]|nr:DUF2283 domain-containing protein [Elusimicrobiota bacterium]
MQITYDPKHNIAYIRLHQKTAQVETLRVSDDVNVDMAPDGTIYGIELLNANEQLAKEDKGKLILINETSNKRQELKLAS